MFMQSYYAPRSNNNKKTKHCNVTLVYLSSHNKLGKKSKKKIIIYTCEI